MTIEEKCSLRVGMWKKRQTDKGKYRFCLYILKGEIENEEL